MAKFGSKATPNKPRSPEESTLKVVNGVLKRTPLLMMRTAPVCSQTKIRPSGANSNAVALLMTPGAAAVSEKPGGREAAMRGVQRRNRKHFIAHYDASVSILPASMSQQLGQ